MALIINEIFHSIQGETSTSGFPSVFIRLTGCNLNCVWCDTKYAKTAGNEMQIAEILKKIRDFGPVNHITITGGEPLTQVESIDLMKSLLKLNYNIQLETNGSILLKNVPRKVRKIVDVKTPSSGEVLSFLYENLYYINDRDELKFVISDIADYNYSRDFIMKNQGIKGMINFSRVDKKMDYSKLAGLILIDRLPVRLNLQLHKIIWPDGEPKKQGEDL